MRKHFFTCGIFLFLLAVFFGAPTLAPQQVVYAQDQVSDGLSAISDVNLTSTDIRVLIARYVQIALGLLGTIAVVIVIYGGFLWMTSGGDTEKISRAKSILKNGAIGLAIILLAFSIATFILNALKNATIGDAGDGWCTQVSDIGSEQGCFDCIDVFGNPTRVEDLSNAGCQALSRNLIRTGSRPDHADEGIIRNVVVRIFFNTPIKPASVLPTPEIIKVCEVANGLDPDNGPEVPVDCNTHIAARANLEVNGREIAFSGEDCGVDLDGDNVNDTVCLKEWTKYRVDLTTAQPVMVALDGREFLCIRIRSLHRAVPLISPPMMW